MKSTNIILTIFLLCLSSSAIGQKIPHKTFIVKGGFENYNIEFINDTSFNYKYFSDTGGEGGSGTYTLVDSVLTFTFKGKPIDTFNYSRTIIRNDTENDTTYITLKLFDVQSKSLMPYLSCRYGNTAMDARGASDSTLHLKIPNSILPIEIEAHALGSKSVALQVERSGRYEIIIPTKYIVMKEMENGEIISFIVKQISEENLLLRKTTDLHLLTFIESSKIRRNKKR